MKQVKLVTVAILAALFITSCSSDDDNPNPVNEEEEITEVRLTFQADGMADAVFSYIIEDDGGINIDPITITEDVAYEVHVSFWNGTSNITSEISAEANDHFITFSEPDFDLTINRLLTDVTNDDGDAIGLRTEWLAATSGNDFITVTLTHEPNNTNDEGGFGTVSGGSTDAAAPFPITVLPAQ